MQGERANFTTIDWMKDRRRDKKRKMENLAHDSKLLSIFELVQGYALVVLIGLCIGLLAALINASSAWLTDTKSGYCTKDGCVEWRDWSFAIFNVSNLYIVRWLSYCILSTIFATTCAFIIHHTSHYAAGSGTPEIKTILGGVVINGFFSLQTLVAKVFGVILTVSSGLAVGKEGPMIHIACCIANLIQNCFPLYLKNEARKREILSAASAAGVAVAFGGTDELCELINSTNRRRALFT